MPEDVRRPLEATVAEGSPRGAVEKLLAYYALACAQPYRGRHERGPSYTETIAMVSSDHPNFQERLRMNRMVLALAPEARRQGEPRIMEALPMFVEEVEKVVNSMTNRDPKDTRPFFLLS